MQNILSKLPGIVSSIGFKDDGKRHAVENLIDQKDAGLQVWKIKPGTSLEKVKQAVKNNTCDDVIIETTKDHYVVVQGEKLRKQSGDKIKPGDLVQVAGLSGKVVSIEKETLQRMMIAGVALGGVAFALWRGVDLLLAPNDGQQIADLGKNLADGVKFLFDALAVLPKTMLGIKNVVEHSPELLAMVAGGFSGAYLLEKLFSNNSNNQELSHIADRVEEGFPSKTKAE